LPVYEALARAYAAARNYRQAKNFLDKARKQLGSLEIEDEDRKIYFEQIGDTEKMYRRSLINCRRLTGKWLTELTEVHEKRARRDGSS
jgi:hypothetical protein